MFAGCSNDLDTLCDNEEILVCLRYTTFEKIHYSVHQQPWRVTFISKAECASIFMSLEFIV